MKARRFDPLILLRWCLLGLAMLTYAQVSQAATDASTAQRNRETVTSAFAAWTAGGQSFFDDILAPDVVWTVKGSGPGAGVYRGRQDLVERAVKPLSARLAKPIRPTVRHLLAEGDAVVIHWDGEAETKDGKPYRNSYVWIFRMRGGRATEVTAFLDLAAYGAAVDGSPEVAKRP